MTYQIKNLLLAYPSDWMIEQKTLDAVKTSIPVIREFYDTEGKENPKRNALHDLIREPLKEVYTIPVFSEKFCVLLRDEINNIGENFIPNDDEDELRQIPEFVLQDQSPELYASFMTIVKNVFNPIFLSLWNRHVDDGGIQIAKYNPAGKQKGAWHHDMSGDITVVVPLNTGDYLGGGTEFAGRGIVPPLPSGNALIFPSFTHLHRGLAVESGDRYLLVFWLTSPKDEE